MVNIDLLIVALVLIILDSIYLNLTKAYFGRQIMRIQGKPIELNIVGLLLCYTFLIFGFNYFIVQKQQTVLDAFFLGLVIYAVYEFTNYALLANWSIITVIMDTLWGGVLFATTAFFVFKIKKMFQI
jgi:uncharacterized membrane protein